MIFEDIRTKQLIWFAFMQRKSDRRVPSSFLSPFGKVEGDKRGAVEEETMTQDLTDEVCLAFGSRKAAHFSKHINFGKYFIGYRITLKCYEIIQIFHR